MSRRPHCPASQLTKGALAPLRRLGGAALGAALDAVEGAVGKGVLLIVQPIQQLISRAAGCATQGAGRRRREGGEVRCYRLRHVEGRGYCGEHRRAAIQRQRGEKELTSHPVSWGAGGRGSAPRGVQSALGMSEVGDGG